MSALLHRGSLSLFRRFCSTMSYNVQHKEGLFFIDLEKGKLSTLFFEFIFGLAIKGQELPPVGDVNRKGWIYRGYIKSWGKIDAMEIQGGGVNFKNILF